MPIHIKIQIYDPLPFPTKEKPVMESSPRINKLIRESDGIVQGFTKQGFLLVQLAGNKTIPIRGITSEPSQGTVLKVKQFPNGIYELMPNG